MRSRIGESARQRPTDAGGGNHGAEVDGGFESVGTTLGLDRVLERRGRAWLIWSFLLCPCHLPLSLAALTTVLAGTSFGIVLRDHMWLAGSLITIAWVGGTGYGFRLIRQAARAGGTCPTQAAKR